MIRNVYLEGKHQVSINPATNRREDIIEAVSSKLNISSTDFYLKQNGKLINDDFISGNNAVHVCIRLFGGKGGFGSMLRAIGAQIEKTTNREACRDLSGRRLLDINEEKRLKEYLEKQDNSKEAEEAKIAKKIAKLRAQPKHEFKDDEYFNARSNLLEDVSDAIETGFKNATATTSSRISQCSNDSNDVNTEASGSGIKRKNPKTGKKQKKKLKGAQWLDEGLSTDDSSDDDSDSDSNGASSSSSKQKSTDTKKDDDSK